MDKKKRNVKERENVNPHYYITCLFCSSLHLIFCQNKPWTILGQIKEN
jgi:hypothetical protein